MKVKEAFHHLVTVWDQKHAELIQKVEDAEKKVGLKETVAECDALKETVDSQRERILKLEEEKVMLNAEIARRAGLVEENRKLQIDNDNVRDKLKGQFKGMAKNVGKREPSCSLNPYSSP